MLFVRGSIFQTITITLENGISELQEIFSFLFEIKNILEAFRITN